MFFQAAKQGENKWWQYLISLFIIFLGWQILGGVVFLAGIVVALPEGTQMMEALQAMSTDLNFEKLGIDANYGLFFMILTFACGLLSLWFCMKMVHKRPLKTLITPSKSINYKKIMTAAVLWFAFMGIFELVSYFLDPENYAFHFDGSKFFILVLISLLLLPIQTSFEELLMRGYLMQGIGLAARNRWVPLIVTSTIFGLLHIANPEVQEYGVGIMMVNYIQIGLMLGIITLMDDSLELALGVHAANNIYGATMVTFSASALKTPALFTMQELNINTMTIAGLIGSFIFILLLAKMYGWSDWSKLWAKIDTSPPDNGNDNSNLDEIIFAEND
jgi:membrane protease YdiL (CAAX protease family)